VPDGLADHGEARAGEAHFVSLSNSL
jgi:hypothetical protein